MVFRITTAAAGGILTQDQKVSRYRHHSLALPAPPGMARSMRGKPAHSSFLFHHLILLSLLALAKDLIKPKLVL
jgi:hypothetical protein